MIPALRIFFSVVLISMLAVVGWASSAVPLWEISGEVGAHPWFIATLFDAYGGFLIFYCWVFYRERAALPRILWLAAILLLGNIATAVYMLILVFRLPADAKAEQLLLRPTAS